MASTKDAEFENVMFDIPISSDHDIPSFSKFPDDRIAQSTTNVQNNISANRPNLTQCNISTQTNVENSFIHINGNMNGLKLSYLTKCNGDTVKSILKLVVFLTFMSIIIYLSTCIYAKSSTPIKCQMCGKPVKFPTFLGDLFGNECESGSMGSPDFDCGKNAACFKMDIVHSEEWKLRSDIIKDHLFHEGKPNHPMSLDPYINDGTFRGCMHGFFHWSGDRNCHFFNSTNIGHTKEDYDGWHTNYTWFATTICACTSDNCN